MRIALATPEHSNFHQLQEVILQAHLHHTWGEMKRWCHRDEVKVVAIAYEGERPVGAAMVGDFWPWDVGVYVKQPFRRNGIGTVILKAVSEYHRPVNPWCGDEMATGFYQQLVAA